MQCPLLSEPVTTGISVWTIVGRRGPAPSPRPLTTNTCFVLHYLCRSPLLRCLVGTTYTLRSCTGTYVILLELHAPSPSGNIQLTGVLASLRIIFGPATLVCLVSSNLGWQEAYRLKAMPGVLRKTSSSSRIRYNVSHPFSLCI